MSEFRTMITAHSGCQGTEIDTMDSVDLALEYEADAIEMDVRVDQRGELRISHNAVTQAEYDKKLPLSQVFERIQHSNLLFNVDLKEQAALYKTLEEAEKCSFPPERLILSGCTGPEQLARDPELTKRARIFLNIEEVLKIVWLRRASDFSFEQFQQLMSDPWSVLKENLLRDGLRDAEQTSGHNGEIFSDIPSEFIEDTVQLYQTLGVAAVNLPKRFLRTPVWQAFQAAGLPLSVWTVNDPGEVQACVDEKVYNITTRDVIITQAVRDGYF